MDQVRGDVMELIKQRDALEVELDALEAKRDALDSECAVLDMQCVALTTQILRGLIADIAWTD